MTDAASRKISRRDLLALIGAAAGGAAMYQAMTSLGFAAESSYRGPIRLEGDPKGASVVILGAGLAGMTAAYRTRPRRIPRAGPRIQHPRRRPELVDPRRRRLYRTRRRDADAAASTRANISIRGPGGFPIITTRCSTIAGGSASRSSLSSSSITTPISIDQDRLRRRAAADPDGQGRFRGRDRRTARQGDAPGRARRGGLPGGPGNSARGAARAWRARRRLPLSARRGVRGVSRLRQAIPAAASSAGR